MIVEDFVCLGRTVPEESKKYGHKVCMAGYSPELSQLLRVYPLPVGNPLKANHRYVLGLSRCSSDSRSESWKLTDRIALYDSTEKVSTAVTREFLASRVASSIDELNDKRMSLGVVRPDACVGTFRSRRNADPMQRELFESCDKQFGANAVNVAPYLRFHDQGGWHEIQLREWGCYEWIRKNPSQCSQLWQNMRLSGNRDVLLLVGNMSNRRNNWLVIKAYSFQAEQQGQLAF